MDIKYPSSPGAASPACPAFPYIVHAPYGWAGMAKGSRRRVRGIKYQ